MNSTWIWAVWIAATGGLVVALGMRLASSDARDVFLPGETTSGHYQIEIACESCHTPYGGVDEASCLGCHDAELTLGEDSHPKSKFTDPRNADRIQRLDATACQTCHVEHRPEITSTMGVTLPTDFCFHCHFDIAVERPSHEGMGFETCASAGCHNFHDNRALYEDFLTRNVDGADLLGSTGVRLRRSAEYDVTLGASDADAPRERMGDVRLVTDWATTSHARASVNCTGCHQTREEWNDAPGVESCEGCHDAEVAGFLGGRHGMRIAAGLDPMSPGLARIPMREDAARLGLTCSSCHSAHDYDTRHAAVEACLGCHADGHTLAYEDAPHFELWLEESEGAPAGTGVSCATCHMPREVIGRGLTEEVRVQHNQNHNLRPNEKMIRDVCMACHGLEFSIDALADPELIDRNFSGRPAIHVESMEMVRRRANR
jgi:hypothetical protein